VSVFSMTNSISLQAGYADLYPVARNVGHSLSNTKFGKCVNWIGGLFSRNVPIPRGNEVTFVTRDGSFNCPEVIARRSEVVNSKLERWSQDTSFSFDAHELDKESLKRVFVLEIEFYQLEQQGKKEYKIIEVLSNKFLGDDQELDRLISVADYLRFPNSCMILASRVFKNFDFKNLLTSDGQMIFNGDKALPFLFDNVIKKYVAHYVGTAGPRFKDICLERLKEECKNSFGIYAMCCTGYSFFYPNNPGMDGIMLLYGAKDLGLLYEPGLSYLITNKVICILGSSIYTYFNVYYKDALKKKLCKKFKKIKKSIS